MTSNFATLTDVERFVGAWQTAGLDPSAIGPIVDLVTRAKEIARAYTRTREAQARMTSDLVDGLLAGDIEFDDAVAEHARATAATASIGVAGVTGGAATRGGVLAEAVQRRALSVAARSLREQGPALYEGHVEPAQEAIRAEVEKLALDLAGVGGSDAAMAAGPKAAKAFARVQELEEQRAAVARAAGFLSRYAGVNVELLPNLFRLARRMAEVPA